VRVYDLAAGRLLPEPIVDPDEASEPMRGYPITRAVSPDGRWAYTLYDGAGEHPFVHALDTVGRSAVCVDLDALAGRDDLFELRLDVAEGGATFAVLDGTRPLAVVDTGTFAVDEPEPEPVVDVPAAELPAVAPVPVQDAPSEAVARPGEDSDGGVPWALVGAASGAVLALAAIGAATIRRRRPALGKAGGASGEVASAAGLFRWLRLHRALPGASAKAGRPR
jgi:hypothetical protein